MLKPIHYLLLAKMEFAHVRCQARDVAEDGTVIIASVSVSQIDEIQISDHQSLRSADEVASRELSSCLFIEQFNIH